MKKKIASILITVFIGVLIVSSMITYAAKATPPLYVKLDKTIINDSGREIGYSSGDPNNQGAPHRYIWNIKTLTGENGELSDIQKNLYCVKADYGQTWETLGEVEKGVSYELYYNMQTERNIVTSINEKDNSGVVESLLTPGAGQYEQLLWIFDNAYIKGENIEQYLENVGIVKDVTKNKYVNNESNVEYNTDVQLLTEEDIIAIQKMAIWYFTNKDNSEYDYDKTEKDYWLYIGNGTAYSQIDDINGVRNQMVNGLYNNLISKAKSGSAQYKAENNYQIETKPANVDITGLTTENDKYILESTRDGGNYFIGPIKIKENNNSNYDVEIIVKDQNNKKLTKGTDYVFIKSDKITELEIQDLAQETNGFYIKVPTNTIQSIDVEINLPYVTTEKILWLSGDEAKDGITLDGEQPIVEIIRKTIPNKITLTSKIEEFDLALRKNIIAVNGVELTGTNSRIPVIDYAPLSNVGTTKTTANYNHRKDPVQVKVGDEVTYRITIYNEGNKAGYATRIVDQLPEGLIRKSNNDAQPIISIDKDGNERNKYSLASSTTIASTNQIILTIIDTQEQKPQELQPYAGTGELDYEIIEIECTVTQEPDMVKDIILTNVAWIDEAFDSEANKTITTTVGDDRDSEPSTKPNVSKNDIADFRGNTNNKADLAENTYHYGEQDDDDFEKLILKAEPKIFDLALFKHIAAVSKDQTFEPGEYITDTGNIDGKYLRAPQAIRYDETTGEIIYEYETEGYSKQSKQPLSVEPGDYVLYTIRVYNEGELDGYASEIKDKLPKGLNFVESNEQYNGIWALDRELLLNEGVQEVTTTAFAKDEEETYLLKAFNPDGEINDENPEYIDAQVLCQVAKDAESNVELINYAQITEDTDKNGDPIEDNDSDTEQWKDGDDDQDIEKVVVQRFDLSLRKFIISVNDKKQSREPQVNVQPLKEGKTTAIYTHSKTPVAVQPGDTVIYTIRVYNEGDINGYASEVKDYLPPYLKYVKDSEINKKYGWSISEDGRIATTTYLANTELKAFDVKNGTQLDSADLQIECIVSEDVPVNVNQTNIAEISEYKYNENIVASDRDSTSDNMTDKNTNYMPDDSKLPTYKDEVINNSYVEGNEDDDDFEKIYVKQFDLALRKFITKVQDTEVTTREPQPKIENGTITYEHTKEPLIVHVGDIVIYTLRIYNEGEIDGYASEITDDIPEYLEYLPEDSTNVEYMWKMYDENGAETEKVEDAVKIKTEYLSKENGEDNLIKLYDGKTLSCKDIKIAFKVKDPNSNTYIITNHAQISDDTDTNGNEVEDIDSTPDKWVDDENHKDDDQDIENVKVQYFDLSLLKFVSKVVIVENGKETIKETGYNGHENPEPVVKVDLHKKKLKDVIVKFGYGITITNEGDIAGYATEITDYVPEGLKFDPADNPQWKDEGNNVISTKQLENTLLQPGESKTIEVIFTWINSKDNMGQKTNTAEISEDKNEYDVPDRDSTPDNKKEGEDDIDIAKVILAITTGKANTYFTFTLSLLAVMAIGIALIRRFVI